MNIYTTSSIIAFILFAMGFAAMLIGLMNRRQNKDSKSGILMSISCICVFCWNFGYAWMSLCFEDDFAYVPRALALLGVTFYVVFILSYVAEVTEYPKKRLRIFLTIVTILSLFAWTQIIRKDAVTFTSTPWGYWYYSQMSWARIIQFSTVIAGIIQYYIIIHFGLKKANAKREKYVYSHFMWFGPALFIGYMADTLAPMLFDIPAVPGSCVGAFVSVMILFRISQNNKVFGLSKSNVSEYVFEDVQVPVVITDNIGRVVLFNNYAPNYFEIDENNFKMHILSDLIDEDSTNDTVYINGTDKECIMHKTQVKDQFGDLLYTIFFMQDVTKERQAMRMMQESREMAEEANKAKSNFLANMSHEIRTPMNAIIGMSEIVLQDNSVSEKTLSQVNEINVAGQNLMGIINDILDISKIEAGKYELVTDEYELPSLLHDISTIIGVRLQESNAVFAIKLDETLPKYLIGDVGRIRQILLNILGNAVKFIKKGSITFTVNWNHDNQKPILYFDVADTGIGIKPENIDKIFGEFTQVDTRKNRNIQGTGLGLAISKHLAEMMGGDITVESVYGEGSTFHIHICQEIKEYTAIGADLAGALERHEYQIAIKKQQSELVKRPDVRALIVDDTKVNLMITGNVLKQYGMQIDKANSGKEAIEMVQKNDYDIVFMDHMMPEMDGVEATRKIRELGGKYESLVIIALTANAINDAKEMFLSEGLQDFIAKPIDPKILDEVLNKWLPV